MSTKAIIECWLKVEDNWFVKIFWIWIFKVIENVEVKPCPRRRCEWGPKRFGCNPRARFRTSADRNCPKRLCPNLRCPNRLCPISLICIFFELASKLRLSFWVCSRHKSMKKKKIRLIFDVCDKQPFYKYICLFLVWITVIIAFDKSGSNFKVSLN